MQGTIYAGYLPHGSFRNIFKYVTYENLFKYHCLNYDIILLDLGHSDQSARAKPQLSQLQGVDYAGMITLDVRGCLARSKVQVTATIMRKHRCRRHHKARHDLLCCY